MTLPSVTNYNEDALPAYTPMPWYVGLKFTNKFFQLELNDLLEGL